MSRELYKNAPLEYALRNTYLEYLSENNLIIENGIIPFGYIEVIEIFYDVGHHYEYYVETGLRKLKKELSEYETIVYKNMHKFCKEYIKQFVVKYKNLSDNEKNNREGYKKALLSNDEFIKICKDLDQ